jgi:septum site-determining protein MinD
MARRFVITSGKGGVGKTTITANLGATLASMGYEVLLVDADIGLKNLDIVLGLDRRIVYTIIDVLNNKCSPDQSLVSHKNLKKLKLLPAEQSATKEFINKDDFKKVIDQLDSRFDYIFIDSPAGIEGGFRNSVNAAKEVIVITTPEITAIGDADRVIGLVEKMGFEDDKINLIINKYRPQMVSKGFSPSKKAIIEELAVPLLGIIPESDELIKLSNRGTPLIISDSSPKMKSVFKMIAQNILGETKKYYDEEMEKPNFFKKMFGFMKR